MSQSLDGIAARAARLLCAASVAVLAAGAVAQAQDKPAWFVPSAAKPAAPAATGPSRSRAVRSVAAAPVASEPESSAGLTDAPDDQSEAVPQYNLPALAPLPALPKTASPPAAVIGVLGVPDIMRASTASQTVQKIIGARRDKLAADYQREQQVWRDMQQSLVDQRSSLSQEQLQGREKALQERVAAETKQFRARNKIIQEAGQVTLAQIERVLVAVIRQVSESRGMNLVLHRQQVALNISEFDITDQVTAQLNTLLPSVVIPPDGEEPTSANTGGAIPAEGAAAAPTPALAAAAPPAGK